MIIAVKRLTSIFMWRECLKAYRSATILNHLRGESDLSLQSIDKPSTETFKHVLRISPLNLFEYQSSLYARILLLLIKGDSLLKCHKTFVSSLIQFRKFPCCPKDRSCASTRLAVLFRHKSAELQKFPEL